MKQQKTLLLIMTIGVFGVVNTQLGIVGILPSIAERYQVSISEASLVVSLFSLFVAVAGLTMPLLFSGINRKKVMLLVLGVFVLGDVVAALSSNFTVLLIAHVTPAFFFPIYVSLAFTIAATAVNLEEGRKAVSRIFIGMSASMVVGVPLTSFLAGAVSLEMSILFFSIINAITFVLTVLFVPSMPVKERLSCGAQLRVLKKAITWLSIVAVIFINGAITGVYSYLSEYLEKVTLVPVNKISIMLMIYGIANIIGNLIAGKLLVKVTQKIATFFPFVLGAVYILLFLLGSLFVPMAIIVLVWGIVAGIGRNIQQYWIISAAPDAPDFANGLFLTSANLGITFGTAVCGLFIVGMDIKYVAFGGLLFLILSLIFILLRRSHSQ